MAINPPAGEPGDPGAVVAPAEAEAGARIDALAAAGKHAEAAELALAAGWPARAADLFERIWDFGRAARAARAAGDLGRALALALGARDAGLVAELHGAITVDDAGRAAALEVYARARRHDEAAVLAEQLGQLDRAIDLYQRAHRDDDAARLLEASGRDREAGRLLERVLDLASGDERALAAVRLAGILARRAAYADAARYLQDARRVPVARVAATRQLVVVLAAMGLRDGARDVLLELRAEVPAVGADLDEFLRQQRAAAPAPPRQPDLLAGRYRVERALGAGGAGRVLLARDEVAGRAVAVKVIHESGRGGALYERFLREARVASALHHPNLVEVYEVIVEQGLLVMEYLPGGSLAQRLAAGEVPSSAAVRRTALELLAGLEVAHHRGVVHRDLKPANVFFDARGSAKLGDFGVAHLLDLGQTQTGGLIGSLAYMSPEQITGAAITVAADLYSLGVTLFEALTGRLPFLGPDFVAQHLADEAPAPSRCVGAGREVPSAWDPILAGLLRKNPDERTVSIAELRRQLEGVGGGGRALGLPRPARVTRPPGPSADEPGADAAPRYQFETPIGSTPVSRLTRALDRHLDRTVVIERFEPGDDGDRALARARQLGAVSSPFVQRALALDAEQRLVVFEAPAGAPLVDEAQGVSAGLSQREPGDLLRMLKRLARALASIHELGLAHGQLGPLTVLIDDGLIPTVTIAGLGPPGADAPASAGADVGALVAVLAPALGTAPTVSALAATLLGAAAPARLGLPGDGEALYTLVDQLEVAWLRAR